jgi:GntR family transcriptional regulator
VQKKLLNLNSPMPLYYQLQEHLSTQIEEGNLCPGDPLPTEAELCSQFNVSRATVREALRGLAERGLIEKRQGVGSFVAARKINEILPGLTSFSAEMRARGFHVTSKVLEQGLVIPPGRVLKALDLAAESQVVRIVRLRFVDAKPFLVSTSHLVPEISAHEDFSGSLYELFETKYGYTIATGQATIEAGLANERESQLLEIQPRDAVLRITWLALTDAGLPIEYSETTYNGNRYRYIVQLRR